MGVMLRMTAEDVAKHNARVRGNTVHYELGPAPTKAKPSKMRSRSVTFGGERFDSVKEMEKFISLRDQLERGEISHMSRQVRFSLNVNKVHICDYIADFVVTDDAGKVTVMDVKPDYKSERSEKRYKGTDAYRRFLLKKRLMKAIHNIDVLEV